MSARDHHGVGVIVRDHAGARFYVQQKDASYPRYPLGYSLFGGAVEPGETAVRALARELGEELEASAAALILAAKPRLILTTTGAGFRYSLFEARVGAAELDALARADVYEGERGVVVDRDELAALPFIWSLGELIADYLGSGRE